MTLKIFFKRMALVLITPLVMGANWAPAPNKHLNQKHIEQELLFFSKKQRKHIDAMARTLYGEARGEKCDKGMTAVAHVILNRVESKEWAKSPKKVVLQRRQFSCWNKNDPNRVLITRAGLENKNFRKAYRVAMDTLCRKADPTQGATHYHSRFMEKKPRWAKSGRLQYIATFGNHLFYKN